MGELFERLRGVLGQGPPLDLAVLFGSAAAGTSRPDSDLDVAVLPATGGLDASEEATLCRRLALAGGADVDLIRLEPPRLDAATLGDRDDRRADQRSVAGDLRAISSHRRGRVHRLRAGPCLPWGDLQTPADPTGARPVTNVALVLAKLTTLS